MAGGGWPNTKDNPMRLFLLLFAFLLASAVALAVLWPALAARQWFAAAGVVAALWAGLEDRKLARKMAKDARFMLSRQS